MSSFVDIPLHPAIVHLPLGIAFVTPAVALWCAFRAWRGHDTRALWGVVAFLQLVLAASAFVAMSLGEKDEDRVEKVVTEERIHAHEARGKQLAWGGVAAFVVTSLLLGASGRALRVASVVAVILSVATAGLAARAGHSGGKLVYVYGAASAHVKKKPMDGKAHAPSGATDSTGQVDARDDD